MLKRQGKDIKSRIMLILIAFLISAVLFVLIWDRQLMNQYKETNDDISGENYQYHCAYISENYDDPFWNSIYEGAKERGRELEIYVESYGSSLSLNYTLEEKMEMAIASQVDAIIIEGTKSKRLTNLIDQAYQLGIVVITVYKDNVGSKRQSFIGVNNFQMGYNIGREVYKNLANPDGEIMVLFEDGDIDYNSQDNTVLNTGMKKYLDEMGCKASLNAQLIAGSETYEVQEKIRSLLRNQDTRPEVIVCTSLPQTICSYQSVVDLDCVGEVKIIGFYTSEEIEEAINKDIIASVFVVNTKQMGAEAVESIKEFFKYGYSSDYIPVEVEILDKDKMANVRQGESFDEESY
ncbi:MAG: substrate-binding domain-containing protein [Lachnospiraceae bacterium]|nr:substrate-binding domain-containing protein [Lachnospiraceae bacterium]